MDGYGKDTASKAKNILGCYSGSMGVLFYEKGRGQNLMRLSLSVGLADSGHEQREGSCPTWALEDTVAIELSLIRKVHTRIWGLGTFYILHFTWSMNHEVYERSFLKHETGNMKHYAYCTTCGVNHETRIMRHKTWAWSRNHEPWTWSMEKGSISMQPGSMKREAQNINKQEAWNTRHEIHM